MGRFATATLVYGIKLPGGFFDNETDCTYVDADGNIEDDDWTNWNEHGCGIEAYGCSDSNDQLGYVAHSLKQTTYFADKVKLPLIGGPKHYSGADVICKERLEKFCKLHNIPYEDPEWLLLAYYG